jgi:hypothetical protein
MANPTHKLKISILDPFQHIVTLRQGLCRANFAIQIRPRYIVTAVDLAVFCVTTSPHILCVHLNCFAIPWSTICCPRQIRHLAAK